MTQIVRWGVLGASNFALSTMARAIHEAEGAELTAIATSRAEKAQPFAAFCPGIEVFTDYDAMLASDSIDAVYIPLPNHLHVEWAHKAMDAGKHVLCEKPIALTAPEIDGLIAKRDATGLFCAEAFMIVHHPQWQRVRAALQDGAIGALTQVEGAFTFFNDAADNIRNRPETGGGSLRDIGVYTLGAARWATGRAVDDISYVNLTMEHGVDTSARVICTLDGVPFHSYTSMRMSNFQTMRFHGTKGVITLRTPFNASAAAPVEVAFQGPDMHIRTENFTPARQYVEQVQNACRQIAEGGDYPWPLEEARKSQAVLDAVFARDQGAG